MRARHAGLQKISLHHILGINNLSDSFKEFLKCSSCSYLPLNMIVVLFQEQNWVAAMRFRNIEFIGTGYCLIAMTFDYQYNLLPQFIFLMFFLGLKLLH
jgi:hypothetical protein